MNEQTARPHRKPPNTKDSMKKPYDKRALVNNQEVELFQEQLINMNQYLESIDSGQNYIRECKVSELQTTLDKLNNLKDQVNRHVDNIKTLL